MYNVRSTLYNLEPLVTTLTVDSAQSSRLDKVTDELDVAKIFAELEHTGLQIGSAAAPLVIFPLQNRKSGVLGTTHLRTSRPRRHADHQCASLPHPAEQP